jgi:hypothetical protein
MQDLVYIPHTRFDARAKREEAKFVLLSTVSSVVLREAVGDTPSIRGAAGRNRMLVISAF